MAAGPATADRVTGADPQRQPCCSLYHRAVELVGRRWTGAILWSLAQGPLYFADLCDAVPGISDRLLSTRLRELEAEGLVTRAVHSGAPTRVSYSLTQRGQALQPALRELRDWARDGKGA